MDFMNCMNWQHFCLGGGVVAAGSGIVNVGATLFAQAAGGNLETITTSIGAGTLMVGSAGLVTAISAALAPYWKDRAEQRANKIVELKIRMSYSQSAVFWHQLHGWAISVHTSNPQLIPKPPEWPHDTGEFEVAR